MLGRSSRKVQKCLTCFSEMLFHSKPYKSIFGPAFSLKGLCSFTNIDFRISYSRSCTVSQIVEALSKFSNRRLILTLGVHMVKNTSDLTALSYNVDGVGKLFSDSKTRHTWTMDIDGETHVVVVVASWNSGKFVVELNGYERFHQITGGPFVYSFKFRERLLKLFSIGERLLLEIDGVAFESYTARAKASQAAMLNSYSRNTKTSGSQEKHPDGDESSDSDGARKRGYIPFSGDLAERLGKKTPGGDAAYEIGSDQSEDFFAAPNIEVKSFVTPQVSAAPMIVSKDVSELTVIPPDLIELSSRTSPVVAAREEVVNEDEHVVTPRDKISPDELANPFAAFDELVIPNSNPFNQVSS